MPGQPFSETSGRVVELDVRDDKRIEPYDLVTHQRYVGL
jgi:hypothetical protein